MRRRRGIIDEQLLGNPPQPSDGGFEPASHRQQRLAAAPHRPLPVRIRQHRMEQKVIELHPADAHPEIPHVRPVHGQNRSGPRFLREKHFLLVPVLQPPLPHPALKSPQDLLIYPACRPLAQVLQKRLRLQLWSRLQHPSRRAPDGFQRIFSGPPVVGLLLLLARIRLPQILPRRVAGNSRFHCTHGDTDSPVTLVNELVDLTTIDHSRPPLQAAHRRECHAETTSTHFTCRRGGQF